MERIDKLIQDLGGNDVRVREKADKELRALGEEAIPALRKAAQDDKDAERAMRARSILMDLQPKTEPSRQAHPLATVRVVYDDWVKGIHFHRATDGAIILKVAEENKETGRREFKTFEATSPEEFKRKYPDFAKNYDLERFLSEEPVSKEMREMPEDLEKRMEEHQREIERLLDEWRDHVPSDGKQDRHRLGVIVGPLGPALRSHLGLKENEGLLIVQIRKGSLAEKSGLRRHDILTQMDGKPIADMPEFRKDVEQAIGDSREFTLDLLRAGKTRQIKVMPEKK